jgi:hypothetical protein
MKDGGKADAEALTEETTLDPIIDAADHHLHHLLIEGPVTTIGIEETTALMGDNAHSAEGKTDGRSSR